MSILRFAYLYAAVLALVTSCIPAEAQPKPKPVEAPQKATLSSLTGNGFEIKGTLSFSGLNMILVQKDKDAFACNIFQSKDGSYTSTCFPIR
jgi:hypothetical protein